MIAQGDTPLAKALREEHKSRLDPAAKIAAPPNFGGEVVSHAHSFSALVGAVAKVYRNADQAIQHNLDNARFMRNDIGIMESLEQRMRLTALLDWHLEPDDPKSQEQKDLCEQLTKIIQRTRRFTEMRRCLLEAIWYGRYAVQFRWRRTKIGGREYVMPSPSRNDESPGWKPIHGDKLVFRYSQEPLHGPTDELLGPVGLQVNIAQLPEHMKPYVHPSERHMAYFFPHWQRSSIAIHKHMIEDSPYESPFDAGAIHGVGIRSRVYWEWFQKQEILAFLMEFLERSAMGIEIWEYPIGNPEAETAVRQMATDRSGSNKNVILFPKPQDPEAAGLFDVRHVEPGMAGAQALQELLQEYYGHRIKRYILGQTLSSEPDGTGMGSGVADIQLDTLMGIVRYDASNHDETMTYEYVEHVKNFNFPHAADIHVRFVSEIDTPDAEKKMQAYRDAWDMGARVKESDVLDLIGAAVPQENDVILQNQQAGQQPDGGQFPGADIPGGGGDVTQEEELAGAISEELSGQAEPEMAGAE